MPAGNTCAGCHGNSRAREGRMACSALCLLHMLLNGLTLLNLSYFFLFCVFLCSKCMEWKKIFIIINAKHISECLHLPLCFTKTDVSLGCLKGNIGSH